MKNDFIAYSVTMPPKVLAELAVLSKESGVKTTELIRAFTHHVIAGKPSLTTVVGLVAAFRKSLTVPMVVKTQEEPK